ncbi:MAG: hypothetical protein F9K18_10495, partial [Thermoanaerobaculia bacterium]
MTRGPVPTVFAAFLLAAAPAAALCAPDAPALAAELRIAFPGREEARTRLDATLTVPAAAAAAGRAFHLEGEVTRGPNRIERFRYRLLPASAEGPVALDFVRLLSAGHYRLSLELLEEATGACARLERELDVPALGAGPG